MFELKYLSRQGIIGKINKTYLSLLADRKADWPGKEATTPK